MRPIERITIFAATALALAGAPGCAYSSDAPQDEGSNSELVGVEPPFDLPGVSRAAAGALFGATEKVRNGSDANFWGITGNSSVQILGENGGVCTAQVINKRFLFTAGHCIADVLPALQGWIQVSFTDTSGNPFPLVTTWTNGAVIPNGRPYDRDIGLVYLFDPIDSCQDTVASCRNSHVNKPVNALFQVFYPGFDYIASSHPFAGYGTIDEDNHAGRLRTGRLQVSASIFTENDEGHRITAPWAGTDARPCRGDSGSALINTDFDRLVHTGALSMTTWCTLESGDSTYAGLTYSQAQWLVDVMASVTPPPDPAYHCTMGTANMPNGANLLAFGCDNDGTVYP